MENENWVITLDEVFYFKEFHRDDDGGGWEFTPYIDLAYVFSYESSAMVTLNGLISGGDFKDSRGHVTPTTAFGMRKMTRKDYNEIKKRQDAKTILRKKDQRAAA